MTDIRYPPLLLLALRPTTSADRDNLRRGLAALMADDPTLRLQEIQLAGDVVIGGMGEQHLEIVVDRLRREFGLEASVGRLRIACRRTVTTAASGEMKFAWRLANRAHYGHVKIHLQPGTPGSGFVFVDEITGGAIPKHFVRSVDAGIRAALTRRVPGGYPVDDVRVVLYDGSYHETDSSELAFTLAGAMAFHDAASKATPALLEPVMRVEVVVPHDCVAGVVTDLAGRRGSIQEHAERDGMAVIEALVPMAAMLGYATDLRARTRGRGTHVMWLERFALVPPGDDNDEDRDAMVGALLRPRSPLRDSGIALPEPDDPVASDDLGLSPAEEPWLRGARGPWTDDLRPHRAQ
jgi:elongation factor G